MIILYMHGFQVGLYVLRICTSLRILEIKRKNMQFITFLNIKTKMTRGCRGDRDHTEPAFAFAHEGVSKVGNRGGIGGGGG